MYHHSAGLECGPTISTLKHNRSIAVLQPWATVSLCAVVVSILQKLSWLDCMSIDMVLHIMDGCQEKHSNVYFQKEKKSMKKTRFIKALYE
jgi:hypothetical protein